MTTRTSNPMSASATTVKKPLSKSSGGLKPASSTGDSVTRRLQTELMGLIQNKDLHATAFPDGDNLFKWLGTLRGGDGTPFEGLTYKLVIKFPAEYPFAPPQIVFSTPVFHPNVDLQGNICLDILKDKWSASMSVSSVLQSLRSLLGDPNVDSPLNAQAAALWGNAQAFRTEVIRAHTGTATSGT